LFRFASSADAILANDKSDYDEEVAIRQQGSRCPGIADN